MEGSGTLEQQLEATKVNCYYLSVNIGEFFFTFFVFFLA